MTIQQEDQAIHNLLPAMAREPSGFYLDEGEMAAVDDLLPLANRLREEDLALPTNSIFYVTITAKGRRIAEHKGGYLGYLKQQETDAFWERFRANATVWAAIISGVAAVVSAGIALWLNNSLDKTNAQVEALSERVSKLEQKR